MKIVPLQFLEVDDPGDTHPPCPVTVRMAVGM
jgi:hypothetical protein